MSHPENSLRERILETSRNLLYSQGHLALSMRSIASEVGVSATSIYLYFDNKDHLLHTLIEESVEELSVYIEYRVSQADKVVEKFTENIHAYVEFALNNPKKYQIIYNVHPDAMSRYPKEKFRKARRCYELLVSFIEEGVAKGLMEVENPVIAAYSIWAQLHGVVSVVINQRLDNRIDKDLFVKESLDHIVQGFLVRSTV